MKKPENESKKEKGGSGRWNQHKVTIRYLNMLRPRVQSFSGLIVSKLSHALGWLSHKSSGKGGGAQDDLQSEKNEEIPFEILMTEEEGDNETVQALKAFARLVINTNDAEVLERAVPSFVIGEWCISGGDLLPVFLAVRERFLATDTSFRVKETVKKQLLDCREWSGWRDGWGWRDDLEGNAITRFCRDQCKNLVDQSHDHHRQFFSAWVFFASLDPDNKDLRGYGPDSYEKSVARLLSSWDRDEKLGDRRDVFRSAVIECRYLLHDGRSVDVTRILSGRDRSSILRSLLRNLHMDWSDIKDVIAFITRGDEVLILGELAEFFSDLPDMKPVFGDLLVNEFLGCLIPLLPSTFTVPRSFDLTPTLTLFLRYQSSIPSLLRYSDTLIYFLDHGPFEQLSSLRPAYDFFQLCLTLPSYGDLQNTKIRDRARFYLQPHWGLIRTSLASASISVLIPFTSSPASVS